MAASIASVPVLGLLLNRSVRDRPAARQKAALFAFVMPLLVGVSALTVARGGLEKTTAPAATC